MSELIMAYGGVQIPVNDLAVTLGYTAGFVTSQVVVYRGVTFTQTITRDGGGNTLSVSQWVPASLMAQWREEIHEPFLRAMGQKIV